ncbi:MAG: hypothetical protein GKR92_07925 [Gammaproteobacteria bacterium]|nr:MAG: hypothetical protein GKR92_07925 [Gammaproteobacteria bacterium]
MKKRILYTLLFTVIILLAIDRSAAFLYKPKPGSTDIVLYTTKWCPYCNSLRIHFQANSIPFTEHDIEKSLSGIAGFWALRARGVPVSAIGPEVVYGYDINTINNALIDLGYSLKLIE